MSYHTGCNRTIRGSVSRDITYPDGSSHTVTIPWSEEVRIDIEVDTEPFDDSVYELRGHVDTLTGAVVATEAAHVQEKTAGAKRIAASLNQGFNGLIRSEISQQTAGLRSRVDSLLLKLKDLGQACRNTRQTMQTDYSRITERYAKVFEELDHEIERRVSTLDAASISVRSYGREQSARVFSSRLCGIAAVTAAENARAEMTVVGAGVRSRTGHLLRLALAYLAQEMQMARDIESILAPAARAATLSLPVLYLEADSKEGPVRKSWMHTAGREPLEALEEKAKEPFWHKDMPWRPMSTENRKQVETFLLARLESIRTGQRERDARIRQYILRLWKSQTPLTITA